MSAGGFASRHPGQTALPWLSIPAILFLLALICGLFLLVDIPPLLDMPGHIGAMAIAAAPPGSPLSAYYEWHWNFTPSLGGELLMKLLAGAVGIERAGWWTAMVATLLFSLGGMATIRALNPRGAYAAGWAAMFLFGFPWTFGFVNYLLAAGLAMLVFVASVNWRKRPWRRALLLLAAQPVVLMCHAIGGLILPLLVAAESLGRSLDENRGTSRETRLGQALRHLLCEGWPLLATAAFVLVWKATAADTHRQGMHWDWLAKLDFLMEVLRDQSRVFDIASVVISYFMVMLGTLAGARWTWRQGLPALAIFAFYVLAPSAINGSDLVDYRLLTVAMLLALGLQDWRGARPRAIRIVAFSGAAMFSLRLAGVAYSFPAYQAEFDRQLQALDAIAPGSKVFVLRRAACPEQNWRQTRLDMLPSLAAVRRQAWTNTQWAIPGLHMVRMKFDPTGGNEPELSPVIHDPGCPVDDTRTLDAAVSAAPLSRVDYLWLVDTGAPRSLPPMLKPVWQWRRSVLYEVRR